MKKGFTIVLTLALLCPFMNKAFGWGRKGHAMVAEIAFSYLDTATRAKVHQYLGDMTIEAAGSWMDDMRSDHAFDYMKTWHYINVEKGKPYVQDNSENVVNELKRVISELEHYKTMRDEDVKKDVLVLFHLVGDLAQPLHTGYGSDKGGNDIKVKYLDHNSNLHLVWDSEIIESENITVADCMGMARKYNKARFNQLKQIDVVEWMNFSRSQLDDVYDFKDGTIDKAYVDKNKAVIENDVYLGGIHLYAVLEHCFKQ